MKLCGSLKRILAVLWKYVCPSSSFVVTVLSQYKIPIVEKEKLFLFITKLENKLYKSMTLSMQKRV